MLRALWLYRVALLVAFVFLLFWLPIEVGDTDLWYHLSHGRFIHEQGKIPDSTYFSFLEPARPYHDYSWLFQATVFQIHRFFGETGLLGLRALLFLALGLTVGTILLPRRLTPEVLKTGFLTCCFALVLDLHFSRAELIRPHAVSYLCLALLILIFDREEKKGRWLAIPIALIGMNFHGIAFPMVFLVVSAYFCELLWKKVRGISPADSTAFLAIALATLVAALATPTKLAHIKLPFLSLPRIVRISELEPRDLDSFLQLIWAGGRLHGPTTLNVLFWTTAVVMVVMARQKRLRIAHLFLFAGAAFLLPRAVRFENDAVLLFLPILAAFGKTLPELSLNARRFFAPAIAFILVSPWIMIHSEAESRKSPYPRTNYRLPVDAVAFLKSEGIGRRLLAPADLSGFLMWELPQSQLLMNLETPFPFPTEDLYLDHRVYDDSEALEMIISTYHPDVIFSIKNQALPQAKSVAPYRPVFFDDETIVFVDASQHPELVERLGLRAFDPARPFEVKSPEAAAELERIASRSRDGLLARFAWASVLENTGRHSEALEIAEQLLVSHVYDPRPWRLQGDALRSLGNCPEALEAYHESRRRTPSEEGTRLSLLNRSEAQCHLQLGAHAAAYELLKTEAEQQQVSWSELARLAELGRALGRDDEALFFYRLALIKAPESEPAHARIVTEIHSLSSPP